MTRPLAFGELVETPDGWRVCVSTPDPWRAGCYRWRDSQVYTEPELVDPAEERKLRHAPAAVEPDDPLPRYIVVRA